MAQLLSMTNLSLFLMAILINGVVMVPHRVFKVGDYDDYSGEDEKELDPCDTSKCKTPNCTCFGKVPPSGLKASDVPQFVMLTFDDAVNPVNNVTYKKIRGNRKNPNECPITLTFYVTHEYNDYQLVNEMYREGHEIAVHSISHESDTEMWRHANETRWKNEMVGMRTILANIARIPESEIVGHRAPFLQTAGDTTFKVLKDNGFSYDSSLPSRTHIDPPIWPYTLDHGYPQDCQIEPCPSKSYPGFWEFPMVQWKRVSRTGNVFHCSMLDACTPQPSTKDETVQYFRNNFNRHYNTNRAPFPAFAHEAWLRDDGGKHSRRFDGYIEFLDEILKKEDVFIVSVREVLDYMKNPVPLSDYRKQKCYADSRPKADSCDVVENCFYSRRNRYMKSCIPCPKRYPWIANPLGN